MATTLPLILPVTVKSPSVPILVICGCALVLSVPATSVNAPVVPLMLPALTLPVTVNEACVPILVICGCALVPNVPTTSVNAPVVPLTLPAVTLPAMLAVAPILA